MRQFTTIAQAKKDFKLSYLGNINASSKMIKNKKVSNNYTYAIYLAPASESGYNVCKNSTPECRLGCLATSGRAGIELHTEGVTMIHDARIKKAILFNENPEYFMNWLVAEMRYFESGIWDEARSAHL